MLDIQHDTLYDTLVAPRLKVEEAEQIAQQEAERRVRAHTARLRFLEQEQVASTVAPASFPTGNRQPSVLALDRTSWIDARAPSVYAPPSSSQVLYADAGTDRVEDADQAAVARKPSIDARAPSVYAPPSSPQVLYADAGTERAEDAGQAAVARKPSSDARAPSGYAPPSSPQVLYAEAGTERAEDAGRAAAALQTPPQRSLPPTPSFPTSSPTLTLPMEISRPRLVVDTQPRHPAPKAPIRPMEVPQPEGTRAQQYKVALQQRVIILKTTYFMAIYMKQAKIPHDILHI